MKNSLFALAAAAGSASAAVSAYSQCGGQGYAGETSCASGYTCTKQNDWYSQCLEGSGSGSGSNNNGGAAQTTAAAASPSAVTSSAQQQTSAAPSSAQAASSKASSVEVTTSAEAATAAATGSSSSSGSSSGGVKYAGVNIAGLDFGCGTDGTCTVSGVVDPGDDGIAQMTHFVTDDNLNAFRLPVGWQYLLNNKLGGTLDSTNFGTYDALMQGCLSSGASLCILDVHNYARWNGQVVGQGGPTDKEFASLWSQLATKYKGEEKVAFGVMNEPHDLDIDTWATSVQAAVTAIRKAGATSQKILLPGTDYTSAGAFISNGSGAALKKVTNIDGSTDNLIFDVHRYLDSDNSGTHTECTTNNVGDFQKLGDWLRDNERQAMLTETGGGPSSDSCLTKLCEELDTLNKYSDVYLGWTGWSAGKFDQSYELSETPTKNGDSWTDVQLVTKCVAGKFGGGA